MIDHNKAQRIEAEEALIKGTMEPESGDDCQLFEWHTDDYPILSLRDSTVIFAKDAAWTLDGSTIPPGQHVGHRCGNNQCVRRSHLKLCGTPDAVPDLTYSI